LVGQVTKLFALQPKAADAAVIAGTAFLAAPIVYAHFRSTRTIAREVANRALPGTPENTVDYARAARNTFMIAVQIGLLLPCGVVLAALTQPFLPTARVLWTMVGATGVLALLFWRSARDLEGHTRAGAEVVAAVLTRGLEREPLPERADQPVNDLLRSLGEPQAFDLPEESPAIGRTLASLNLRGRTGATILAVRREGRDILLPAGGEILEADDVVILAGSIDAIGEAKKLLGGS
jgi:CPA2 family monovalent cation:H+ antiporter-2